MCESNEQVGMGDGEGRKYVCVGGEGGGLSSRISIQCITFQNKTRGKTVMTVHIMEAV